MIEDYVPGRHAKYQMFYLDKYPPPPPMNLSEKDAYDNPDKNSS